MELIRKIEKICPMNFRWLGRMCHSLVDFPSNQSEII